MTTAAILVDSDYIIGREIYIQLKLLEDPRNYSSRRRSDKQGKRRMFNAMNPTVDCSATNHGVLKYVYINDVEREDELLLLKFWCSTGSLIYLVHLHSYRDRL
jgi:hypothetical protein